MSMGIALYEADYVVIEQVLREGCKQRRCSADSFLAHALRDYLRDELVRLVQAGKVPAADPHRGAWIAWAMRARIWKFSRRASLTNREPIRDTSARCSTGEQALDLQVIYSAARTVCRSAEHRVFLLHHPPGNHGRTFEQIAVHMNLPNKASAWRLYTAAVGKLRSYLQ